MKNRSIKPYTLLTLSLILTGIPSRPVAQPVNLNKNNTTPLAIVNTKGELEIKPSETSSKDDFDFLVGEWDLVNRKLRTRLNNSNDWFEFSSTLEMKKTLMGIGNVDHYKADIEGKLFEGISLRLFDPVTRLWSIYWADSNTGTLDKPVVGSFQNNVGNFFTRDTFNGKDIIMQFQYDKRDPNKPIWSQAFSADNGKTWEWNWYMYMSKSKATETDSTNNLNANQTINTLELRNYVVKPGTRERFLNYFEEHFTTSQNVLGGYTVGQFRVKGVDNNFFWMRGFKDMASRSKFLPAFYGGPFWKKHRDVPNGMLVNNDNVHLLKPLTYSNGALVSGKGINSNLFKNEKGIVVIDYYTANEKLDKLIALFGREYLPMLQKIGIVNTSLWISELTENDFTALPVFQDKNLMVAITYYKNELDYQTKLNLIESAASEALKNQLQDIVTVKNSLILYPTEKSF